MKIRAFFLILLTDHTFGSIIQKEDTFKYILISSLMVIIVVSVLVTISIFMLLMIDENSEDRKVKNKKVKNKKNLKPINTKNNEIKFKIETKN